MAAQNNLKVFAIAGRTDASGAAAADVDQEELRLLATLLLNGGIGPNALDGSANPNAFQVRQDTGANLQVKVGSGTTKRDLVVMRGTVAGQGVYIARLDTTTVTLVVPAVDPALPARYAVFVYVNDVAYSGTAGRAYAQMAVLRGTPNASPQPPNPDPTWSAYYKLWEFTLAANATAVTNAILDTAGNDKRILAAVNAPRVADGITAAEIGAGAVGASELNAAVAGAGITGGGGSALALAPDGTTLELSGDTLRVKANGIDANEIADRWPKGLVAPRAYGNPFADETFGTGWHGITGCSVEFTAEAGRAYRITGHALVAPNGTDAVTTVVAIGEALEVIQGSQWRRDYLWQAQGSGEEAFCPSVIVDNFGAGVHTVDLRVEVVEGGKQVKIWNTHGVSWLAVEDIGLATPP